MIILSTWGKALDRSDKTILMPWNWVKLLRESHCLELLRIGRLYSTVSSSRPSNCFEVAGLGTMELSADQDDDQMVLMVSQYYLCCPRVSMVRSQQLFRCNILAPSHSS